MERGDGDVAPGKYALLEDAFENATDAAELRVAFDPVVC